MKLIFKIFALIPLFINAQHAIKGTLTPAKDFTFVFLYKSTPNGANYIDRATPDSNGNFEIKLEDSYPAGIYKIVYATPPEENNFDLIYNGKESIVFNFSKGTPVNFTSSEENKIWASYQKSMDMVQTTLNNYFKSKKRDKKGFISIFNTLKNTQEAYENLAKDKLASSFITSSKPYIPTQFQNKSSYFNSLKSNYFVNVDFNNTLLQSSDFLYDKLADYVFNKFENPTAALYKSLLDNVNDALSTINIDIKSRMFQILWQKFVKKNNSELANYIADQYLMNIAISTNNKALQKALESYKKTSVGSLAPDFEIINSTDRTTLHNLKGYPHYLLVFWSSTCGHCLESLPKINELTSKLPNLKVVAYALEDNEASWEQVAKNYPNFIHHLGLGKWKNPIVDLYGISGTPTYYLLDTNKVITHKPYGFDDLEAIIKSLY